MTKEQIQMHLNGKAANAYAKQVWNAALDTAAEACDKVLECKTAARIRELKK